MLPAELEREGFWLLRGFFDPEGVVAEIRDDLEQLKGRVPSVYDAAKKLPSIYRLISDRAVVSLYGDITGDWNPLVQSYGLRIDKPNDLSHQAPWHQESAYQSGRGLGFWTPLQPITEALGPLEIAVGSHHAGKRPLSSVPPPGSLESYARLIEDEAETIAQYEIVKPLLDVGDLLVLDWNVLHKSGENRSDRDRLSVVWRLVEAR